MVASIPVLGLIVTILSMLLGLGAIWYVYYDRCGPHEINSESCTDAL